MGILDQPGLFSAIISWLPDGKGFKIHNKKILTNQVLPKHFKDVKFTSFTRKLRRWGFTLKRDGYSQSSYSHPLFIRGDIQSCKKMRFFTCEIAKIPSWQTRWGATQSIDAHVSRRSAHPPTYPELTPSPTSATSFNETPVGMPFQTTMNSSIMMHNARYHNSLELAERRRLRAEYMAFLQETYAEHHARLARDMVIARVVMEQLMNQTWDLNFTTILPLPPPYPVNAGVDMASPMPPPFPPQQES